MAKNSIADYSATAASNTDIQSVDIDEGCAPSAINNAIRELMADLADMNAGTTVLTSPSASVLTLADGSSSAPALANTGDTNTGIFFPAADTVGVAVGGTETVTINSTSLTSTVNVSAPNLVTQNLIVNPEFRYDQEGFSGTTGVGASDDYIADQWRVITGGSASARWTFSIESAGGVSGTRPWAKFLNTTADGSPGASEAQIWEQPLEAQNIQSLLDSSGLGATVVSFDVFAHVDGASSITFPATIAVGLVTVDGTARQYIGDITITAADTWERVSLAIPADATASIDNNIEQGLSLRFGFYSGANQQATANTWENSTNCNITANTDNFADATNNYIGITAVKLEPGGVPTPFVSEDYVVGLGRCQRYFFQDSEENTNSRTFGAGTAISFTQALIHYEYPSSQRVKGSPALAFSAAGDFLLNVGNTPVGVTALANYYGGSERSSTIIVTIPGGIMGDKEAVLLKSDGTSAAKISYSSRF
jgi:hypothetical protein